jgi:hypothetical protein
MLLSVKDIRKTFKSEGAAEPRIVLDGTDPHNITVKPDDPRLGDIGASAYKSPYNGIGPSVLK